MSCGEDGVCAQFSQALCRCINNHRFGVSVCFRFNMQFQNVTQRFGTFRSVTGVRCQYTTFIHGSRHGRRSNDVAQLLGQVLVARVDPGNKALPVRQMLLLLLCQLGVRRHGP